MAEAGEAALRELRTPIASLQVLLERLRTALEHLICGNAERVLDAEELAELVEQRQSEAGVAA